jgi:hypothetical protein
MAQGDQVEADRLLEKAIAILQAIEARYEIAEQIGEFGWYLLRKGRKSEAQSYLLKAAELFEALGAFDQARRHNEAAQQN